MTKSKKKEKRSIPLRASGESIVNEQNRPSKVLFDLALEAEKVESAPSQNLTNTTPYHPLPPPTNKKNSDISPKRDYTKVANSINRDAVPSGLFKGTSKNTYDVLYQKTRGAIVPTRFIKAVQSDLLIWTNLSHNTLRSHLKHLQSVGLVKIHYKLGDNNGAQYEIFLPEEIDLNNTPYHPLPPPTTSTQKLVGGSPQNVVVGGGGISPINTGENVFHKTLFKDNNINDDEGRVAFSEFIEKFSAVTKKFTGKEISANEKNKWGSLAELLILELEMAASRTETISSVPAFLTEILRRKLLSGNTITNKREKNSVKPDVVGKPNEAGEYEKKPLDNTKRETALRELRDFAGEEFLNDFEKWYTPEDWKWLMNELGKIRKTENKQD